MYSYLKVDRNLNRFVFLCHGFRFRKVSALAIDLAGAVAIHGFAIVARVLTKIRLHFHQQFRKSISNRLTPSKSYTSVRIRGNEFIEKAVESQEYQNLQSSAIGLYSHIQYCSDPTNILKGLVYSLQSWNGFLLSEDTPQEQRKE